MLVFLSVLSLIFFLFFSCPLFLGDLIQYYDFTNIHKLVQTCISNYLSSWSCPIGVLNSTQFKPKQFSSRNVFLLLYPALSKFPPYPIRSLSPRPKTILNSFFLFPLIPNSVDVRCPTLLHPFICFFIMLC